MGDIEALRQADLAGADIAAALDLSSAAGWNQTAADWAIFIAGGCAVGLFDPQDRLVATAAALPYDNGFGWISMVIVAPDWRGRGLASRLMRIAIGTLQARGCAALLDATPAGAEVYGRLGFVALGGMERWAGSGGAAVPESGEVTSLAPDEIDRLVTADAAAFGAGRRFLLADFLARDGAAALAADGAYLVIRRGQRATQLGPLIAASPVAARRLLAAAIGAARGPVFLDLLDPWTSLVPLLVACGFRRQRPFRRMALGRATLPGDPSGMALAAGPEFG
jgi:ribosomal protein S18 acetylase RimI-like enzyme